MPKNVANESLCLRIVALLKTWRPLKNPWPIMGEADHLSLWTLFLPFHLPGQRPPSTPLSFAAHAVELIPRRPKLYGLTAVLPFMAKITVANGRSFTTVTNAKPPGGPGALTDRLLHMAVKMKKRNPGFRYG
jgi:hypothetical protein